MKRMNQLSLLILPALLILAEACTDGKGQQNTIPKMSEPVPVKVMALRTTASKNVIEVSGRITTDEETTLGFKTGGVVKKVFVKEGDKVRSGQLLATLDLTEINAGVAQAQLALEKATRDFARVKNLYEDSVATLEQLQNAQTGLDIAREQLKAAEFNKGFSEIHAQADGIVLQKFVSPGQVVGIGDPILIVNGTATGRWVLKAGVSDKQWAAIQIGDPASITVEAFAGRTYNGKVTRKAGRSDVQTGAFSIEIEVAPGETTFASGMFAKAVVESGDELTSWAVPYESVLDANNNEGFVFVTTDQKTAVKKAVTIASFNGKEVLISKGLGANETLIVSGSAYLTDKAPIYIVK